MSDVSHIYLIYQLQPRGDDLHRTIAAKFYLDDQRFEFLEDHVGGWLEEKLRDKSLEEATAFIRRLARAMYYEVVALEDVKQAVALK